MRNILFFIVALICFSAFAGNDEITLKSTCYYAGSSCGSGTACGDRVVPAKVLSGEHRWVALSPDLYKHGFRFNDTIVVVSESCPFVNGLWVVKDKMSARLNNRIDFLIHRQQKSQFHNGAVTIRKATKSDLNKSKRQLSNEG